MMKGEAWRLSEETGWRVRGKKLPNFLKVLPKLQKVFANLLILVEKVAKTW